MSKHFGIDKDDENDQVGSGANRGLLQMMVTQTKLNMNVKSHSFEFVLQQYFDDADGGFDMKKQKLIQMIQMDKQKFELQKGPNGDTLDESEEVTVS